MTLYHGSDREISRPDVLHSRTMVDFGAGFYTTPLMEQAVSWCGKFKRRGKAGIISQYVFDETAAAAFKALRFEAYSEAWLNFVLTCRRGRDSSGYEIVIGGVANDKVFNTIELYFDGLIDKPEAIKRLRYKKPNLQICFRTQAALDCCLHFERSWQV